MVLGIITAIAACPAIVGTNQAVLQGQHKSAKEKHRGLKTNLVVTCTGTSSGCHEVNGRAVVLLNNKLYINTPALLQLPGGPAHPFAGYYLPHPSHTSDWGRAGEGLVSTISDDPPQLNWVYVDTNTHEVKYGLRTDCEEQLVGPWSCTPVGRRMTLEGWEGFVALEEKRGSGVWEVAFDRDDDGLVEVGCGRMRRVECELERREMRTRKAPKPDVGPDSEEEEEEEEEEEQEQEEEEAGGEDDGGGS